MGGGGREWLPVGSGAFGDALVRHLSVDGWQSETEKKQHVLRETKTEVCPLGLAPGRLLVAAHKQWVEEREGDEELATGSVDNSEVFLWQRCCDPPWGGCVWVATFPQSLPLLPFRPYPQGSPPP